MSYSDGGVVTPISLEQDRPYSYMQGRGRESIAKTVAMNRDLVFKH